MHRRGGTPPTGTALSRWLDSLSQKGVTLPIVLEHCQWPLLSSIKYSFLHGTHAASETNAVGRDNDNKLWLLPLWKMQQLSPLFTCASQHHMALAFFLTIFFLWGSLCRLKLDSGLVYTSAHVCLRYQFSVNMSATVKKRSFVF